MIRKPSANLDLLRAVAVLLVLTQHLFNRLVLPRNSASSLPPIGTFGVFLFFVHTCLVLMYSMERSRLDGVPLALNFYVRRIFRIYPLSILAVLTAVALHLDSVNGVPGLSHVEAVNSGRIVSNLLLVQNLIRPGSIINVLWSLPLEVQMYVFLPILFLWARSKRSAAPLGILWLVSVAIAALHARLLAMGGFHFAGRLSLLQYVPCFLPGIMAFMRGQAARIRSFLWLPFILLLTLAYAIAPSGPTGWMLCLLLGLAIPYFEEIQTGWLRWTAHKIATYSYGIYLSHQFCIWLVADPLSSCTWWIKGPLLAILLIAIPIGLYYAIEKPMITVGADLAERLSVRRVMPAGVQS